MKCYLCKQKRLEESLLKNGYQLFRCKNCGLIFYDFKRDYKRFLEKQYAKGYFTGKPRLDSYFNYGKDKANIVKNMRWYLKETLPFKKKGKLLDVGCAYGYFMEVAKEAGFEVFGVDPSDYAVKQAKKKFGKKVKKTFLSEVNFREKSFDVVTLFDVFEHLKDPWQDLEKVRRILKDNGILIIATGDTGSLWAKITGRRWTFWNPPQHIFYFNQENITKILKEVGFEVLRTTKNGKWLSLRYILHLARTVGESKVAEFFYHKVKDNYFGKIPLYLRLNDNMVVFATKK